MSAQMVKKLGILKAGAAGLILQASLLTMPLAVYWSVALSKQTSLLFFLGFIPSESAFLDGGPHKIQGIGYGMKPHVLDVNIMKLLWLVHTCAT
ncbi:solute carrier family 40 member 3, chloroplastic [Tanacetum coccineum]